MSPMRGLIDRRSYLTQIVYDPERGDFTERAVAHPFAAPEDPAAGVAPPDGADIAEAAVARVERVPEGGERALVLAGCPG
jgi:hypothetical protein